MDRADRNARMMRQLDIAHPDKLEKTPVTIIGAGGIGSFTGQFLAKMGVTDITVFDFDEVVEHNLPNQMYPMEAVDTPKAKALEVEIERLVGDAANVTVHDTEVDETTKLKGLVISAVDSMEARKEIWKAVRMNMDVPLFVDARMGAEIGQVRAVQPVKKAEIERFEQSMDGQTVDLPCTAKAIVYNGAMIGSLIANVVKRYAMGEKVPAEVVFSFPDLETGAALFVTNDD